MSGVAIASADGVWEAGRERFRHGAVYRLFSQFHWALGIHTTLRCPLECAHCFIDSSPRRRERLDRGLVLWRIREAAEAGRLKLIIVSGGEPFLETETLRDILEIANLHGVFVTVNTSAFFAKTEGQARRFLAGFPHLHHVSISADEFHEPDVPLSSVRNAAAAALSLGVEVTLMLRALDPDDDPFLHRVRRVFDEGLLGRVSIDLDRIQPNGRGAAVAARAQAEPGFPEGACGLANQPVVDHDGQVLACCAYNVARHTPALQFGNIAENSLVEMSNRADADPLLQAIRVWGPKRLAETLSSLGLAGALAGRYAADDICDLCQDIMSKPELVAALRATLGESDYRSELEIGRLLRFGERMGDAAPPSGGERFAVAAGDGRDG